MTTQDPLSAGQRPNSRARRASILRELEAHGRVEVAELAQLLGVADETVRRDLRSLEKSGALARAHGGAIRVSALSANRSTGEGSDVSAIALAAAELIPESGSVFLGAGVYCEELAALLPNSPELHVVTHSVAVALAASRHPEVVVYNLGGLVDPHDTSQSGQWARENLERLSLDIAFITPEGLTADGAFNAATPRQATVLSEVVRVSEHIVILAESAQLQRGGLVEFTRCGSVHRVLTDAGVSGEFLDRAAEAGIAVQVTAAAITPDDEAPSENTEDSA